MPANKFVLKGAGVEVEYANDLIPGLAVLVYKQGAFQKTFTTNHILTDSSGLGELVSVALVLSADTGGERFGFFLPSIEAPKDQSVAFRTIGVYETFGGHDSVARRLSTWRCIEMAGTAYRVIEG